ncbi:hypothetical protein HPB49_024344 [Dermacentor silvarum]|uniref:Uncharacterized protein n=1 Tax=Dermacentor silvarum TaxID=543639 RepID=A0ACB8E3J1_DERSI|nr:hypothetical protein HPB49_024344 [Dermacentor silvarum]
MATCISQAIVAVQALWYFSSGMVYVVIFPQLLSVIHFRRISNPLRLGGCLHRGRHAASGCRRERAQPAALHPLPLLRRADRPAALSRACVRHADQPAQPAGSFAPFHLAIRGALLCAGALYDMLGCFQSYCDDALFSHPPEAAKNALAFQEA